MQKEEIALIYKDMLLSSEEMPLLNHNDMAQWNYLMQFLPTNYNSYILDAGCGNGKYSIALSKMGYWNITSIDLFDSLNTNGSFRYQRNSIDSIELPDACADFVYSFSVLYYLPDLFKGLKELHRVMKPEAVLLLSSHTKHSLFTLERVIKRINGKAKHLKDVRFRSAADYVQMMKSIGFEILDVDGYKLLWTPPIFRRIGNLFPGTLHINKGSMTLKTFSLSGAPKWLKTLRSIFGYHFLIAARKRPNTCC